MTMAYGTADERAGIATIHRAYELGVTLFDTAEMYGMRTGSNEQLLDRAVRSFRERSANRSPKARSAASV